MKDCSAHTHYQDAEWQALGTTCRMLFSSPSASTGQVFRDEAIRWLSGFENKYSRFQPESMISRINQKAGVERVAIDSELADIFRLCDWFHWLTGKVFDPTMAAVTRLWESAETAPPAPAAITDTIGLVDWRRVEHDGESVFLPRQGMALDLGGIGKEYAVDRVVQMALDRGIEDIMVNFGQDVRTHGQPPEGGVWKIGLENPETPSECRGGVGFAARAIASSGNYARKRVIDGRAYGHILDPRSGYPVENDCLSVSVIAPSCTEAGILSTSAFILGRTEGIALINRAQHAAGCIFSRDGDYRSRSFDEYLLSRQPKKTKREKVPLT